MNLRQLVDEARDHDRPRGVPRTTITALAGEIQISRAYLYEMMRGTRKPSKAVLERLADALGYDEDVVLQAIDASAQ